MKKIILLSSALVLFGSYSANAEINVNVDFGSPAVVEEPVRGYIVRPDYPSEHYDIHRHRHNDYWARKQQEEHEHHDNGNHGEGNRGNGNHDHR